MPILMHLPAAHWPAEDHLLFDAAYRDGDIFDDRRGPGQHLSTATRRTIYFAWGRWLGFLAAHHSADLSRKAADRIHLERVRSYIEHLRESMRASSVAALLADLYSGARLVAPNHDWTWLKAVKTRLQTLGRTKDRFDRLTPAYLTLDLGIELMEKAREIRYTGRREREVQFRDGLIISILSLWPIRRRSIVSLTVSRHLKHYDDRIELHLLAKDTKGKRPEEWSIPQLLVPYVECYLGEMRPRLLSCTNSDAFWPSLKGGALKGGQIYTIVSRRTQERFGKAMSLHDFRRAAATFLAMDAPEKVGLTPGILQHANPETGSRIYNLARSVQASRRHVSAVANLRVQLKAMKEHP